MKKKKNYLKAGILLLGLSLLLWNCQKDEINQTEVESFPFKITKVNSTSVQQNKLLTEKLNKIQQKLENPKNGVQSKNIYSNQYDFTINTDFATYIENEDGTYHSYTFQISREVDSSLLENLLLSLQTDGTYKTILVAYNLTPKEKENIVKGIPIDFTNKVTYSTIKDDSLVSDIFSKSTLNCIWISTTYCKYGNHPGGYDNGIKCPGYSLETTVECLGGTGGGSGEPGDPDTSENTNDSGTNTSAGSGGTNTGGTTTTNPDVTSPTSVDYKEFYSTLSFIQKKWCDANFVLIDSFLFQNKYSIDAYKFASIAIDAIVLENAQVDWVDQVILDSTVLNNQKVKCVYDKLKGLSSTIFNDIINDHFESSKNSQIRFKIETPPNGLDAHTRGYTNNGTSFFEIRLDPAVVANSSNIEIALMLIHESIHAELLDRCIQLGIINAFDSNGDPNFTNTSITYTTYDELFAILVYQYKNFNGTNNKEWNHDIFTVLNYRTNLAQNLVDIHPWLNDATNDFLTNVNNDALNLYGDFTLEQLMGYISWIGLEETQEFINAIQNNPLEYTKKNYVENAARANYNHSCN